MIHTDITVVGFHFLNYNRINAEIEIEIEQQYCFLDMNISLMYLNDVVLNSYDSQNIPERYILD